eukprot:TRINITY_DN214_c0_g1_i5.p3 TRINITY_DN214_c0_g1~~TRINITY_DN214_c0_g1_i5.p3  ORF type:complete len:118 (-),score=13.98 TRINITY_DN214_c0_g1_i5:23-376(-)
MLAGCAVIKSSSKGSHKQKNFSFPACILGEQSAQSLASESQKLFTFIFCSGEAEKIVKLHIKYFIIQIFYILNFFYIFHFSKKGDTPSSHVLCVDTCLLYTSPSPRDRQKSRMPSSA